MNKKSVRQKIIDTAARLFYKQGYGNTGINQIIEEAGIAKSSLYQHFQSKEDLLMEYLEQSGQHTREALAAAISGVHSPGEKIIAVFDYLETLAQENGFQGCSFLNIVHEIPGESVRIKGQIKAQKDLLRQLFAETLKPMNKQQAADEIYTLFEGALIANKVHNEVWPIVTARNIVRKLLDIF